MSHAMTRADWVRRDLWSAYMARTGGLLDTCVHPAADHAYALACAETGRRLLARDKGIRTLPEAPHDYERVLLGMPSVAGIAGTCQQGTPGYDRERTRAKLKHLLKPAARRIYAMQRRERRALAPSPEARGVVLASLALLCAREVAAKYEGLLS